MWKNVLKKGLAGILILVLVPYIVTVFFQGKREAEKTNIHREYGIFRLSQEVSEEYDDEMLKVQAVLVRTSMCLEGEEKIEEEKKLSGSWRRRLENAWDETEGLILTYEGAPALAPFHALSNGSTRDGKEALGTQDYPYLRGKDCIKDVSTPEFIGTALIPVEKVAVLKRDSHDYVTEVKVGEETCTGEAFREAYGIVSSSFSTYPAEGGTLVVTKGVGHGLGLSQHTANEMAKAGKNYKEILEYFFKDVKIEKTE